MTTKKNNIKELGISLNDLYEGKKQVNVHLTDKSYVFSLILKGTRDSIDCKLSSFGANLWVRTNKGTNYEKYKTIGSLQSAIKRLINHKVDTKGDIQFSLSDEVFTF